MDLKELREKLEESEIAVQYRAFKEGQAPELPYLIFYVNGNDDSLRADNKNFFKIQDVVLELYTEEKDVELEEKIEEILSNNNIEFEYDETYIETEDMFESIYYIQIATNKIEKEKVIIVDYAELDKMLNLVDKLDSKIYDKESFNDLLSLKNQILEQYDVLKQDEVYKNAFKINDKIDELIKLDFEKLDDAFEKVDEINKQIYTIESYNALLALKDEIKDKYYEMDQSQIDNSVNEINVAISNLIEKSIEDYSTENLVAPLYWASIGRKGSVTNGKISLSEYGTYAISDFIKIPDFAYEISLSIKSDSGYVYMYSDNNENSYIGYDYRWSGYQDLKPIEFTKKAKYIIIATYRQTSDSIKNVQANWGSTLNEWTPAPDDIPFLNANITK